MKEQEKTHLLHIKRTEFLSFFFLFIYFFQLKHEPFTNVNETFCLMNFLAGQFKIISRALYVVFSFPSVPAQQ